ncbi:hypothetical protein OC834_000413 [Tilletia horrida]|nr:hypothetical protein OC834_000413 [Tilletia horrida]
MPPSRFATSPWRNFVATTLPDEHRKHTGLGDSAVLRASDAALYGVDSAGTGLVRVHLQQPGAETGTSDSSSSSSSKVGAGGGACVVSALALSPFGLDAAEEQGDVLAVGTQQGAVKVIQAVAPHNSDGADKVVAEWSGGSIGSGNGPITALEIHPHASGLLLAAQASGVHLVQLRPDGGAQTVLQLGSGAQQLHSAGWSVDGALLGTTSADQRLALWDPRASVSQPAAVTSAPIHGAKLRPTRLAFTQTHVLTSGFDMGRQREWAVWDVRALSQAVGAGAGSGAVHRASIPSSSTAVLLPLVDIDRSLVYLHGKGDASMHVVDLALAPYTAKPTPLPYAASTLALAPLLRPAERAMKGEIAKIFLNTSANDAVIPLSVTIPRRQYLDFHEDIYPPTFAPFPAHSAEGWLAGTHASRFKMSQDPARRQSHLDAARQQAGVVSSAPKAQPAERQSEPNVVAAPSTHAAPTPAPAPVASIPAVSAPKAEPAVQAAPASVPSSASAPGSSAPAPTTAASQTLSSTPTSSAEPAPARSTAARVAPASSHSQSLPAPTRTTQPAPSRAQPSKPTNNASTTSSNGSGSGGASAPLPTDWSRRFLAGSTPLLPELNNVGGISTSLSPESRLLGVTITASGSEGAGRSPSPKPGYLVFPLAGPGGRVGVHPLSQPGRFPLPADIPALDGGSGTAVVDFACSPFLPPAGGEGEGGGEVYVLNADSKIRKFVLPVPPAPLPVDCLPLGPSAKRTPTQAELERSAVRLPPGAQLVLDATRAARGARLVQVEPHPVVRGLVGALVGGPPARFLLWREPDKAHGGEEVQPVLEVDVGGATNAAFGFAWSPDGELVAVAGKDKKLRVGDVRAIQAGSGGWTEVAAHDSPRAFKLVWLSNKYILSTGHGLGSIRQLKLYELTRTGDSSNSNSAPSLKVLETLPLDSSPAVLWPWWDADTNILLLYARGERAVSAFEVRLPGTSPAASSTTPAAPAQRKYGAAAASGNSNKSSAFQPLPAFGHASPQQALAFLTKRQVDVRSVEVAAAYLFSSKGEIQRVGWSITRARPEYFQDDVFVETEAVEEPGTEDADAWLGRSYFASAPESGPVPRRRVSLRPADMQPLSQAPAVQHTSKLAKGPIAKELTDKEKEDQFLEAAFRKVKDEDDVKGANVGTEAAKRAPANDDWSDED